MNLTSLIRTAARWKIPRGLALEVISRDQCCIYCNGPFSEDFSGLRTGLRSWEHIINDVSLVTIDNIALCCIGCNSSKGNKSLDSWLLSKYCQARSIDRSSLAPVAANALGAVASSAQEVNYVHARSESSQMKAKTSPRDLQHLLDSELFAELDRENDTDFQTEDLVKIYRAKDGPWSEPMSSEQFKLHIDKLFDGPTPPNDSGHITKKRTKHKT